MTAKIVDCYHYAMPQLHLNPSKSLHIVLPGGQETAEVREENSTTTLHPAPSSDPICPLIAQIARNQRLENDFARNQHFPACQVLQFLTFQNLHLHISIYGEVTGVSLKAQKKKEFRQKYVRCYTHNKASEAPATELSRQGKQGRTKYKTILKKKFRDLYTEQTIIAVAAAEGNIQFILRNGSPFSGQ